MKFLIYAPSDNYYSVQDPLKDKWTGSWEYDVEKVKAMKLNVPMNKGYSNISEFIEHMKNKKLVIVEVYIEGKTYPLNAFIENYPELFI